MSQHYTNSMDEICVPVIKKILGHYLELIIIMNYKEINILMAKCIKERNKPYTKSEEFRKALINAEEALRNLKAFCKIE